MRRGIAAVCGVLALGVYSAKLSGGSDELLSLIETERSFARAASEQGIRDAFLNFFAPDSVALVPEPRSAITLWRQRQSRSPAEEHLTWEPRAGGVAASGELGWLTGPSTYLDLQTAAPPRHGNYLSIWRRQLGGQWRVYLDVGTKIPRPAPFDPEFAPVHLDAPYRAGGTGAADGVSIADSDAKMNATIIWDGMAKAYAAVLAPAKSRLHRQDAMPQVGRDAIVGWLEEHDARWAYKTAATGAAQSGDLGYSYGTYQVGRHRGGYVRVWARDDAGRWWLMADVATQG